jgi:hypothetical protein
MLNKKVLPSSIYVNASYEIMGPKVKMTPIYEEMSEETESPGESSSREIDIENYESLLNHPLDEHDTPSDYALKNTARAYDEFVENTRLPDLLETDSDLTNTLGEVISGFEGGTEINYVEHREPVELNLCNEWVMERINNEIKVGTPVRKKKRTYLRK